MKAGCRGEGARAKKRRLQDKKCSSLFSKHCVTQLNQSFIRTIAYCLLRSCFHCSIASGKSWTIAIDSTLHTGGKQVLLIIFSINHLSS